MPAVPDFRSLPFDLGRVDSAGMALGRTAYRKLYGIENILRVTIHSVLSAQLGPTWWASAVDPVVQNKVQGVISNYATGPGRAPAARHELYYTFLPDLGEIARANSHLFLPVIPDIHQWVLRLERLRLPRNVVGHMNWPGATDRQLIQSMYTDLRALVVRLSQSGLSLLIP